MHATVQTATEARDAAAAIVTGADRDLPATSDEEAGEPVPH
jgi:hypothetical protein